MGERISTARARELGDQLRQTREAMGLSGHLLAQRLGWSTSRVSRIESGATRIAEIDVVRYAAHCGVPVEDLEVLLDLCREPGTPGYWLSNRLGTLIFHEDTAASSSSYDPLVVPGLLQTEEYATALIGENRKGLVGLRMARQHILHRRGFEFFIHEQALRLRVGGNRVMNEQLLKIVLLADQPQVTVRVVPAELGERSAFGAPFVMFRYAGNRPLVYLEHGPVGLFLEEQEHVSRYLEKLTSISKVALDRRESRELLAGLASEFDRPEVPRDAPDNLAEEHLQRRT